MEIEHQDKNHNPGIPSNFFSQIGQTSISEEPFDSKVSNESTVTIAALAMDRMKYI
jgi:hypothetical protein